MDVQVLLPIIRQLHARIRDAVVDACERAALEDMARVVSESEAESDTIYAVDRVSEELLVEFFEQEVAPAMPLILIAEGLAGGQVVLPRGAPEPEALRRCPRAPVPGPRRVDRATGERAGPSRGG